jgi:2'-deoxynucleoside 5'-phosphate N-hydrolase
MFRKAYMSGPLTGLTRPAEIQGFYEALDEACAAQGVALYLPHRVSDPLQNPGMTPQAVYALDRGQVSAADLIIAYVGLPSLGVGCEIEIAGEFGVPVVLLAEQGAAVSRMIRGHPAVSGELRFSDFADGARQLAAWLAGQSHGEP